MLKMSGDELAYDESSDKEKKAPSWMLVLSDHCKNWLQALPKVCLLSSPQLTNSSTFRPSTD